MSDYISDFIRLHSIYPTISHHNIKIIISHHIKNGISQDTLQQWGLCVLFAPLASDCAHCALSAVGEVVVLVLAPPRPRPKG